LSVQEKRVSIYVSLRIREPENLVDTIAFVDTIDTKKIVINNTVLKISKLGTTSCNLLVAGYGRSYFFYITSNVL